MESEGKIVYLFIYLFTSVVLGHLRKGRQKTPIEKSQSFLHVNLQFDENITDSDSLSLLFISLN